MIREEHLTDPSTMMAWIEEIVSHGIRRPGYPADRWCETWARDRFVEAGLQDVRLDPIDAVYWEPHDWSLEVWRDGNEGAATSIPCYAVPFSADTGERGLAGELALGDGPEVRGKIAVVENEFTALRQSIMPKLFARWVHDPDGEMDTLERVLPFGSKQQDVTASASEAGAIGFVGILRGLPWETDRYYVPYHGNALPLPGVWLSAKNGDLLRECMSAGATHARLTLTATLEPTSSHNVIGTLPGESDEWIIVGSHHDAPWASAVEDGGGIALVLAVARYWSRVPRDERPHNLLFLLNGGHMCGGSGLIHFVESNREFIERQVITEIHLEHPACEARGAGDGTLVATDAPEVRWWFTSFAPPLEAVVKESIRAENLGRSLLMPPEDFPRGSKHPPTDAAFFHPLTPIVSFLTAPMYLFDEADTIDKVHVPSLRALTRATIRIINGLADETAAGLRSTTYAPQPRTR